MCPIKRGPTNHSNHSSTGQENPKMYLIIYLFKASTISNHSQMYCWALTIHSLKNIPCGFIFTQIVFLNGIKNMITNCISRRMSSWLSHCLDRSTLSRSTLLGPPKCDRCKKWLNDKKLFVPFLIPERYSTGFLFYSVTFFWSFAISSAFILWICSCVLT